MDRTWIVVLESVAPDSGSEVDVAAVQRLIDELAAYEPTALHDASRYALQLRIESGSAAEAMFSAVVRWRDAARARGLPAWELARAEVMTLAEYEADMARADMARADCDDRPPTTVVRPPAVDARAPGQELLHRVFTDSLTGLAQRELFRDRVRSALLNASAEQQIAVLVVDVDRFATVNRSVGYAAGDQALIELASRLTRMVDTVTTARVGGDAFAALITQPPNGCLEEIAARVIEGIRVPLDVCGQRFRLTASVGVACTSTALDADGLIANAETALGAAKRAGGDAYRLFEASFAHDLPPIDLDTEMTPDRMAYVVLLQRAAVAANESLGFETAAASVLQQVCTLTGWTAGHLWNVGPAGALMATNVWNPSVPGRLDDFRDRVDGAAAAAGASLPGRVLATGHPAWTQDVADEAHAAAADAAGARIQTMFAFPVLVQREVVAILEFFSERPSSPDELLTDVMASVCAQLGRVIERRRAQAALTESEERYRTLSDSAPMMIWRAGTDARCTYFNSTWLEFTGRPLEDELGDGWADGVHPDDLQRCLDIYLAAFTRREPFEMEYRLRRADGEYRWLLDRGRPTREGDAFSGYVGGCVDVTDMRLAEQEVRDREARFRALVQNTDVIIAVLAADGTLLEEYVGTFDLGYGVEPRIGRFGLENLHPEDRERAATAFATVLSRPGDRRRFEGRIRHADGTWRWIEAVANNLLDDPSVRGVVLTVTDITARKQAQEAVVESAVHLREARSLAQMGTWSHDLAGGASYWSEETYLILGRSPNDRPAGAEALLAAVHPGDRRRVEIAMKGGRAESCHGYEFRVVHPTGDVRRVHSRSTVVYDDSGTPVRAVGTLLELGPDEYLVSHGRAFLGPRAHPGGATRVSR